MIAKYPFAEAPHMANDFTRVNFGWWACQGAQRADIFEYGTALAAACDCPGAFISGFGEAFKVLRSTPRIEDILETFRRWELARESGFNHYSHFFRLLMRKNGVSPYEWRHRLRTTLK